MLAVTVRTVVRHLRACLVISAPYALAIGALNAIARTSTDIVDPTTVSGDALASAQVVLVLSIFVAINVFIAPVTLGALSLVGSAAVYDDAMSTRGIVRRAADRSADAIATGLVIALFLVAPIVLLGFVSLVLMIATWFVGFVVLVFGSMILGLPLVYLFVRFSLAIPVVMREGRGPIGAMRRSRELVHGAWWQVFGVGVAISLVIGVVLSFASIQSYFGSDSAVDFIAGAALTAVAAALMVTLYGVASGVLYASRAPEDTLPPEVLASEARQEADASQ